MQHAGRDHRRGREHPDAQPDHLRPGRDPLPSVRAEGDRARRATPTATTASIAFDARAVRPPALRAVEPRAHAGDGPHRLALRRACPADVAPETRRYYQQLTRFSAALAFLADVSMGTLGGALKRKEKLSARLGDILSLLYLCSATLKRYEDEGRQAADAPLMHWAIWDAMFKAQNAFEGRDLQLPEPAHRGAAARGSCSRSAGPTSCRPTRSATRWRALLIAPSATRDRLTAGMFIARRRRRSGAR